MWHAPAPTERTNERPPTLSGYPIMLGRPPFLNDAAATAAKGFWLLHLQKRGGGENYFLGWRKGPLLGREGESICIQESAEEEEGEGQRRRGSTMANSRLRQGGFFAFQGEEETSKSIVSICRRRRQTPFLLSSAFFIIHAATKKEGVWVGGLPLTFCP